MNNDAAHIPVLLDEILDHFEIKADGVYVDGTLGMGGHSKAILERLGPKGRLIALDCDERSLERAKGNLEGHHDRCSFVCRNFRYLNLILEDLALSQVDGVLFDFGISSVQLDDPERGLSFQEDGPLDMRLNQKSPVTAEAILRDYGENELANLIFQYGEERYSRRIARRIVQARSQAPIETTEQLKKIVMKAMPLTRNWQKIHPATRTFQALRIAVNEELVAIEEGVLAGIEVLKPGGMICAISFHSLEDRIVKNIFRNKHKEGQLKLMTKKPICPGDEEVKRNSRSRSAKLRVGEKI